MTSTKRRALTTDDLMRRQEEPNRKRIRSTPVVGKRHAESEGSVSGEEATVEEAGGPSRELGEDGGENDEEDGSGDSQFEQDEDDVDLQDEASPPPERLKFSRTVSKPREQLSAPITSKSSQDTFLSLGVSASLEAALSSMSIRTPTGVQAACIPPLLAGKFLCNSRG